MKRFLILAAIIVAMAFFPHAKPLPEGFSIVIETPFQDNAVITQEDIISYDWKHHIIETKTDPFIDAKKSPKKKLGMTWSSCFHMQIGNEIIS